MFNLGSLIPIKNGLQLVQSAISKKLKQRIKKYDLIYDGENHSINFRLYDYKDVEGVIHEKVIKPFKEGKDLAELIKNEIQIRRAKLDIKGNDIVKLVVLNYPSLLCEVFVETENKQRIRKEIQL